MYIYITMCIYGPSISIHENGPVLLASTFMGRATSASLMRHETEIWPTSVNLAAFESCCTGKDECSYSNNTMTLYQVYQDLLESKYVRGDCGRYLVINVVQPLDRFIWRSLREAFADRRHHVPHIDWPFFKLKLSRRDLGKIQDIIDGCVQNFARLFRSL
jgi:hypothetical protein